MNSEPGKPAAAKHTGVAAGIATRVGSVGGFMLLEMVILLLAAGRLDWLWPWVYLGVCLVSMAVIGTITLRKSPETVAERARPDRTKEWDRAIAILWLLLGYIALPLVAGLDARLAWTRGLGAGCNVGGAVVLAAGTGLTGWAMIANAYFSTAVRIQSDRGHTVCSTGPYRFVRHPGYVGYMLQTLGTALVLGSLWALIPGVVAVALMTVRTSLEDRMLQAELPGYREYAQQVRHRLVPGVW